MLTTGRFHTFFQHKTTRFNTPVATILHKYPGISPGSLACIQEPAFTENTDDSREVFTWRVIKHHHMMCPQGPIWDVMPGLAADDGLEWEPVD